MAENRHMRESLASPLAQGGYHHSADYLAGSSVCFNLHWQQRSRTVFQSDQLGNTVGFGETTEKIVADRWVYRIVNPVTSQCLQCRLVHAGYEIGSVNR